MWLAQIIVNAASGYGLFTPCSSMRPRVAALHAVTQVETATVLRQIEQLRWTDRGPPPPARPIIV